MTRHNSYTTPWKLQYDQTLSQYYYINTVDGTITFDSPCEVSHSPSTVSTMSSNSVGPKHGFFHKLKRTASSTACPLQAEPKKRTSSSGSVLSKIGTALSLKSSKSRESSISSNGSHGKRVSNGSLYAEYSASEINSDVADFGSATLAMDTTATATPETSSMLSGLDDEFLLNNLTNFKNFAGTSMVTTAYNSDEDASIDSMQLDDEEEVHSFFDYTYIRDGSSNYYYYNDDEEEDEQDHIQQYNVDKELERRELRLEILKDFY